ncbi:MAG: MBL fold metallo-hydrolase [bacterium]|nr:MBL fold metallo-hydrolase [bacterium]
MSAGSIKITILVDNTPGRAGLIAEHGLSVWIEAEGRRILFDTGQGKALQENAHQLGIRLDETDMVVLSHGHYDHTGGLADMVRIAPRMRLVLHPDAVLSRYSLQPGRPPRSIGMPTESRSALEQIDREQRLIWATQPLSYTSRIGLSGPIPRQIPFEEDEAGGHFFLDPEGKRRDCLADDQALWIEAQEGIVICVGCCHAGLINTLSYIRRLSANSRILALIGGFHLLEADSSRLERTVEALSFLSPKVLIPCHCTGEQAIQRVRGTFGEGQVLVGYLGLTAQF